MDELVGRATEVERVRTVAQSRDSLRRTLVVTGPRGVGKTSIVEHALAGFDGEVLWLSGQDGSGAAPWAALLNSADTVRSVPGLDGFDHGDAIEAAVRGEIGVEELGRRVAERLRALPARRRPVVLVADDVHRCDPLSLALIVFVAHLNHTFDISYVFTCLDSALPPGAEDLDRLEVGGLDAGSTAGALRSWTGRHLHPDVAEALRRSTDGNPWLLRTVSEQLSPEQLSGHRALTDPASAGRTRPGPTDHVLAGLDPAELRTLACFALEARVPVDVLDAVGGESVDALVQRGLLSRDHGGWRVVRAALGWLAEQMLSVSVQQQLCSELAEAWRGVGPIHSALYACRADPAAPGPVGAARTTLRLASAGADRWLTEALARAVVDGARPATAEDWLTLATHAERAGHLLDARDAFERATVAPDLDPATDYAELARWRGFLSQITDDPALAVPSSRLLGALDTLRPAALFEVATRTAWNALLVGSPAQARTYLDRARQVSHASRPVDRALWRLVDASWEAATGEGRAEPLREATLRWRHAGGERTWYEDVLVVHTLLEAGAVDDARQHLAVAASTHRLGGPHAAHVLTAMRVRVELASWDVPAALGAAAELLRSTVPGPVHVHGLGPALVRLEALAGLSRGTLVADELHEPRDEARAFAEARAERDLVEGRFARAAVALRALLRLQPPLPPERRWAVLADLLECLVALGDLDAVGRTYLSEQPSEPADADVLAARAAALAAPSFGTRASFGRAVRAAEDAGLLVEQARTELAFARRLAAGGSADEAERLRANAALLFGHHALHGWRRHAEALQVVPEPAPAPVLALTEALDVQETAVVTLLLQGLRNQQVADRLYISLRTLEKSLTRIYAKLGVSSKARMISLLRSTPTGATSLTASVTSAAGERDGALSALPPS